MFLYALVRPAFEILLLSERISYHYKKSVALSAAASLGSVIFSILLVVLLEDKLKGRIYGTYLPLILLCLVLYLSFFRTGFSVKKDCAIYALKICIPYIPHALAMTVLTSTDRIMITHYCGEVETALYSMAYTCALAVTVLWSSVNTAFAPWLGEKIHNKEYPAIYAFSSKYVLIVALPVLGMILLAPEMLYILGGPSYVKAEYVIPPVMGGCFIQFIYSMFVDVEQFQKKTVGMAIASVLGAVINLVLNYLFIPRYGYIAAAYTTLVGYLFLLIAHFYLVTKLKMAQIYNLKCLFGISAGVLAFSFIAKQLYYYNVYRYIFTFGCVVAFIILALKLDIKRLLKKL
jgi:O-antigen/teichoic acid export membrane protein